MIKPLVKYLLFIVLWASLITCSDVYQSVSSRNFAHVYDPNKTDLHPGISCLRIGRDSLRFFIRVPVDEIGLPEVKKRDDQVSGIIVRYFLLDSLQATTMADSGKKEFHMPQLPATNYAQVIVDIRFDADSVQFVEIETEDIYTGYTNRQVLRVYPLYSGNPQLYIVYFNNPEYPLTRNSIKPGDSIRIDYSLDKDSLWAFHLSSNLNDSLPFDSVFCIPTNRFVQFQQEGGYLINADSSLYGGITLVQKDKYFPALRTADQLVYPLRLLLNDNEWEQLMQLTPKKAVDTFWMVAAGGAERAKELIRVFYNRVQLANYRFSSTREGWKTHKGRLLTLAGLPDEVELSDTAETWYYYIGKKERLKVPFAYNDSTTEYELQRNDSVLNGFLYHQINSWRKGKR